MRARRTARVVVSTCVVVVVVVLTCVVLTRGVAARDDDDDDDDDFPVRFLDVRGRSSGVMDAATHNALVRIDASRIVARASSMRSGGDEEFVVTPSRMRANAGDVVDVRVRATSTNATALATHWLAAYSPAGADVTATAPVKYAVLADVDASYVASGAASARFRLTSHRAETYDFVLFASSMVADDDGVDAPDVEHAVAIARSDAVAIDGAMSPMWPRVTLPPGWAGASARVAWQSGRNASHGATLSYRVIDDDVGGGGGDVVRVRAMTTTYDARDLCGGVAAGFGYRHPGFVHVADIVAPPGAIVEYYISDDVDAARTRYEMTMPPAEDPDASMTIAMFADMGRGSDDDSFTWDSYGRPALNVSAALSADARDGKINAAFLFGDLSYAVGFASVWDEWASQIQNWTSRVPFLTNMGNHELDAPPDAWLGAPDRVPDVFGGDDSGGECGVPAATLFPSPRQGIDADWFAVTLGSIRVVSIDTEVDFTSASQQGRWLARELASIDRIRTPWVVVGGHRPGVIDSTDGPDHRPAPPAGKLNPSDLSVMQLLQEHVWPLLVQYNVTLAFWGHNHVYQRSCAWSVVEPGADDGCVAYSSKRDDDVAVYVEPGAPVNIVVGTGGARHTHNGHGHAFTEKSFYKFGYVRLTALNRTHMYGEFQDAGSGYGDVLDKFLITQRDYGGASNATATLIAQLREEVSEWKAVTYVMAIFTCATLGVFAFLVYTRWRAAHVDVRHRFHILQEMDDVAQL